MTRLTNIIARIMAYDFDTTMAWLRGRGICENCKHWVAPATLIAGWCVRCDQRSSARYERMGRTFTVPPASEVIDLTEPAPSVVTVFLAAFVDGCRRYYEPLRHLARRANLRRTNGQHQGL